MRLDWTASPAGRLLPIVWVGSERGVVYVMVEEMLYPLMKPALRPMMQSASGSGNGALNR
ncbi:MAG: hypothetical protein QGI51_03190 [Dehalococcoidales bacterium]|nr:hypothetical protein [Dehalococcoidales bacterium]